MQDSFGSRRFERLPRARVGGIEVPVAVGRRARLLGLALLDRKDAGHGLLLPACSSVHTFGMRFSLDLVFLDRDGCPLALRRRVGRGRFAGLRGALAVLELPSPSGANSSLDGGEFSARGTG